MLKQGIKTVGNGGFGACRIKFGAFADGFHDDKISLRRKKSRAHARETECGSLLLMNTVHMNYGWGKSPFTYYLLCLYKTVYIEITQDKYKSYNLKENKIK